jgi:hypothetical protein
MCSDLLTKLFYADVPKNIFAFEDFFESRFKCINRGGQRSKAAAGCHDS